MACRRRLVAASAAALSSPARVGGAAPMAPCLRPVSFAARPRSPPRLAGTVLRGVTVGGTTALACRAGAPSSIHPPAARAASASGRPADPPPTPVLTSRPVPSTVLLTLNRPAALNALNEATMHALLAAAADADADPGVRAIIIFGGGDGKKAAFAAGADLRELAPHSYTTAVRTRLLDGWRALRHVRTPLIAAVEGYALGGGCELAAACDVVVAGEGALFGQPEVGLGVVPGMGATQRLPRAVGKAVAMDMVLAGRRLTAREAAAAGLVSRVVPTGGALAEAQAVAAAIAASPPGAVAKAKELVNAAFEMPLAAGLETELRDFWACFGTEEQRGGMAAFLGRAKKGAQV